MARPALDAETHRLKGTRATRPSRAKAPEPSNVKAGKPKMPHGMPKEARRAWRSAVALLEERGTLSPEIGPTLELYARCLARYREASAEIECKGLLVTQTVLDSHGVALERDRPNPALAVVEKAEKQLFNLGAVLGLNPVSREKVKQARKPQTELPAKPGSAAALCPELFLVNRPAPKPEPEGENDGD